MGIPKILRQTFSVCPVCLERIPARHVQKEDEVYLEKECSRHGFFSTIIWRNHLSIKDWLDGTPEIKEGENLDCPHACGLCPEHLQDTCCVLLEVTKRCNLHCSFCFAESREEADPSFAQIKACLTDLAVPGKTLVQLSGGEPTLRKDLPEIVAAAKEAGCRYVQLNSNGIRLAQDRGYVEELAKAGLSFLFMQFDGTDDQVYRALRGTDLWQLKKKAIENCRDFNIGVTLVPTIVPGINDQSIGEILHFAISMSPAVRGVHFQPVSYFGRVPQVPSDEMRFTLDELTYQIQRQTEGIINMDNLLPSCCDHPLCGFHGSFVVMPEGIVSLSRKREQESECCSCSTPASADQNRAFVARHWERDKEMEGEGTPCSMEPDIHNMDYFLQRVKSHGFTVTAMAFQDAGNLDLERLRRCSLHVYDRGKFVPFCAYYLTGWDS